VIRYPDDPFDRIWKTPDPSWAGTLPIISNTTELPPVQTPGKVFFVPPKVMQDAWVFTLDDSGDSKWVFFSVYPEGEEPVYMTPSDYVVGPIYYQNLNMSQQEPYDVTVGLDYPTLYWDGVFSTETGESSLTGYILQSNNIRVTMFDPQGNDSSHVPSLNAIELYAQYGYNFSYTSVDDSKCSSANGNQQLLRISICFRLRQPPFSPALADAEARSLGHADVV
jgi:hypothetical protein